MSEEIEPHILRKFDINIDLIDLKTLKPLDTNTIFSSVKKTGKLLVVDSGPEISSFASEIVSLVCRNNFHNLKRSPEIITAPDIPEPTSYGVTDKFKFNFVSITNVSISQSMLSYKFFMLMSLE